ncbi:MAG: hypothetical protein HIU83_17545, partial [Proteobacteria bacterium]|nr:hypothetical protein [Pseudomonadota bacterium]
MAETVIFDQACHKLDHRFVFNEEETKKLRKTLSGKATVSLDDLRRVALWKLDRVVEIPEGVLQSLQALATSSTLSLDSHEAQAVLLALVGCPGVGFPMASAFLKFLRPDVFPIIDVRAYRALFGKKLYPQSYTLDLYLRYARRVEEIAQQNQLPLAPYLPNYLDNADARLDN